MIIRMVDISTKKTDKNSFRSVHKTKFDNLRSQAVQLLFYILDSRFKIIAYLAYNKVHLHSDV